VLKAISLADIPEGEVFLKTGQLLKLRTAVALVGILLSVALKFIARSQFDLRNVLWSLLAVVVYSSIAFALLKAKYVRTVKRAKFLNAILLAGDVITLTALVHFTFGVESDLYVLYLMPILLSSYTFSRPGIYLTCLFVSASYLTLLLIENFSSLSPFLRNSGQIDGLVWAYLQRLWGKIIARSAILVGVTFIWGYFCGYIADLAQQVAKKLREQLTRNQRLVAEVKAQAAREKLINSINSALVSTLDLDLFLHTAGRELKSALDVPACAIACPKGESGLSINDCLSVQVFDRQEVLDNAIDRRQFFPHTVCSFFLERKSSYERKLSDGTIIKTFVIPAPDRLPEFVQIKEELSKLALGSLIVQPIIYGDQSEGIILIADRTDGRMWSAAELELVKAVAGHLAVAVENAELVEKLSKTNEDLRQKNFNLDNRNVELRAVQSQLVHQEKMASLGRLVAGIAHELNNPINFVHGNLPYLKEYCEDLKRIIACAELLPDKDRHPIDQLKQDLKYNFLLVDLDNILADLTEGTERIRHIIKNLRSFSRLDEAELKEASINEGIESTLKILSQYYGKDRIPVRLDLAPLPPVVCYPGQLNQVWMNLLSNAAQAVACVSEPYVAITTRLVDGQVLIGIADNGPGIAADVESKIFEPFFTTKPVGQGTGLGLSICHSIIERHHGKIWFESGQRGGTIFKLLIPVHASTQALAIAQTDRKAQGVFNGPSQPV